MNFDNKKETDMSNKEKTTVEIIKIIKTKNKIDNVSFFLVQLIFENSLLVSFR